MGAGHWRPSRRLSDVRPQVVLGAAALLVVAACSAGDPAGEAAGDPAGTPAGTPAGGTADPTAHAAARCTDLTDDEVTLLLGVDGENWTGDEPFMVTAARRAAVDGQNDFFTSVVYVQGGPAGSAGEVYVFATAADDLSATGAGLMGANPFTRDAWAWGAVAQRGAPLEDAAREAVAAAPVCLP